jgi:hypothetical protein
MRPVEKAFVTCGRGVASGGSSHNQQLLNGSNLARCKVVTATALTISILLAMPLAAQITSSRASTFAEVREHFAKPPDDARIMMRWWWFGPAVDKAELQRELETMKLGGIGGVEVQPVYPLALDDSSTGLRNIPYLSDAFIDSLRFAAESADKLGLRFDLTLGSGWPYGGPSVPANQAAGMLRIQRVRVTAGEGRDVPLPSIVDGEKLVAVFFTPNRSDQQPQEYLQIDDIHAGRVHLPQGAGELLFFLSSRTGMMVKRAAVGAEGFVVDHYDHAAVEHYLASVGDRLMQAFPTRKPYAIFCDSLEDYNSDWMPDFPSEFQKRRGYDLLAHLPALVSDALPNAQAIRHDWARTLTELFNEHFAEALHQWAEKNGTRLRMQAYGIPPAELSSYALVDLPEGEGPQWKQLSATRWASSASHIYGVPVTSSETWTWLHSPVFRATPLDMKAEADRHFLEGINQLVGHGWPYTPKSVEYPGWRFYAAAVFDEKNPWWIVMPDITAYLQRVSYLLRQGESVNDVAVYLPNDDAWANFHPGQTNLFEMLRSRIGTDVIDAILASGHNFDFFDEGALEQKGRIDNNTLLLGSNRYSTLVLPNVESIPTQTYRRVEEFARAGGVVVATRRVPSAPPGLLTRDSQNAEVREITQHLFQDGNSLGFFVPDDAKLVGVLSKRENPDLTFTPDAPDIGFVHRRLPDADIYFIANTSNLRQVVDASFRVSARTAQWWNAMTGTISTATVKMSQRNRTTIALDLEPYASRILVFSQTRAALNSTIPAFDPATIDISHDWRVTFGSGTKTETMHDLHSWTEDPDTRYFSGQATYEKGVTISAAMLRNSSIRLDFGEGKPLAEEKLRSGMQAWLDAPIREAAVVYVNGQRAGSIWCPPYSIEIRPLLYEGENLIRVDVANLALNYMAGHSLPDYRLLRLRYGVRFEAQDMDKVQAVDSGLLQNITLKASNLQK